MLNAKTHLQFATNFLLPKFAMNPDASFSMSQVQIHPLKGQIWKFILFGVLPWLLDSTTPDSCFCNFFSLSSHQVAEQQCCFEADGAEQVPLLYCWNFRPGVSHGLQKMSFSCCLQIYLCRIVLDHDNMRGFKKLALLNTLCSILWQAPRKVCSAVRNKILAHSW